MKPVFEHLAVIDIDVKIVKAIERLLKIWQDRNIFESKIQADLSRIWTAKILEAAAEEHDNDPKTPPPPKKQKLENHHSSAEKRRSSGSHKGSGRQEAVKEEKKDIIESATSRLSGGDIEEMLWNSNSSP